METDPRNGKSAWDIATDANEAAAKEKADDRLAPMAGSVISSTPDHGVGEQEMTFRMAANAIWNKLNFAMGVSERRGATHGLAFRVPCAC